MRSEVPILGEKMRAFLLMLLTVLLITWVAFAPLVFIWAISLLSGKEPVYSGWTWLAAFLILLMLGNGTGAKFRKGE